MVTASLRRLTLVIAVAYGLGGCAFVPRAHPFLEEARRLSDDTRGDGRVAQFAPAELTAAGEALERARAARDSLDDTALVDHLAYIAKQRLWIARMAAEQRAAQATVVR